MTWKKPEDLELVAECDTLPEVEVIAALLKSAGIESMIQPSTDSTIAFTQSSIFGAVGKDRPYKLLVQPDDAVLAREIIEAQPDEITE